jgi:hypothetical protein
MWTVFFDKLLLYSDWLFLQKRKSTREHNACGMSPAGAMNQGAGVTFCSTGPQNRMCGKILLWRKIIQELF